MTNMNYSDPYYERLVAIKPFGWEIDFPPTFEGYSFEKLDPFFWVNFFEVTKRLPYYAGVVYLILIFGIQRYMKNRPAFELKGPLFCWNLFLGIFSLIGFWRTLPEFLHVVSQPNGFYTSVCIKKGINVPAAFWALMFSFSKYVELGDTVFIVLRKRPLIFLQWFHHLVTMWVVWTVAPLVEPIVRWYGVLNYGVHTLMYPYFAFKTIGWRIPRIVANVITTLQLTQMIIGFGVNMASLYYKQTGYCVRYPESIAAFKFVYGTFILLFGNLFIQTVLRNKKKKE